MSALHVVGLYWVSGHAGVRGNEIADWLTRGSSAVRFVGSEPALAVSMQDFGLVFGWLTGIGDGGEVLVIPKHRLEH
jgi:hypothetical protein